MAEKITDIPEGNSTYPKSSGSASSSAGGPRQNLPSAYPGAGPGSANKYSIEAEYDYDWVRVEDTPQDPAPAQMSDTRGDNWKFFAWTHGQLKDEAQARGYTGPVWLCPECLAINTGGFLTCRSCARILFFKDPQTGNQFSPVTGAVRLDVAPAVEPEPVERRQQCSSHLWKRENSFCDSIENI